jgi:hypothetical protein
MANIFLNQKVYECEHDKCFYRKQSVILCQVDNSIDDNIIPYNSNPRYMVHIGTKGKHAPYKGKDYSQNPIVKFLPNWRVDHSLYRNNLDQDQYEETQVKDDDGDKNTVINTLNTLEFGRRRIPEIHFFWCQFKNGNEE